MLDLRFMDAERVLTQLERVLSSPQFTRTDRLGRFLRLIVEESLSGGTASVKEYRIGVEVYDRGAAFDPRIDPIVRVEASRLRAKLLEYYAGPGATDAVIIAVPKGGYAPEIRERRMPAADGERSRIDALPVNPVARNAYLRGMFALSSRQADLAECVPLFREALAADPLCAPAWAGLSQAYWVMAWFRVMPQETALPLAREAALRTIEIDPDSAQALCSLGVIESGLDWKWAEGEQRFERALELQPTLAIIHPFYAVINLLPRRRLDDACATVSKGLALDPFHPLFQAMATYVYAIAGRDEDALRQHELGVAVHAGFSPNHAAVGLAHERAGRLQDALGCYRRAIELAPGASAPMAFLGHALAVSGAHDEARVILGKLLALPQTPELDVARIHSGLRDADATLDWLHRAADHRTILLVTVPPDWRFAWLHEHPRFQELLARMNLSRER